MLPLLYSRILTAWNFIMFVRCHCFQNLGPAAWLVPRPGKLIKDPDYGIIILGSNGESLKDAAQVARLRVSEAFPALGHAL